MLTASVNAIFCEMLLDIFLCFLIWVHKFGAIHGNYMKTSAFS
jgi:hypothetical protein